MAKEIKFNIKLNIDGKEQLVTATSSVKELKTAIGESQSTFQSAIGKFNNMGFALQGFSSAANNLQSVLQGLAGGYQASLLANTQLATVMRQRMNATQEDIDQIKQVVNAQKELGVVSGTVQIRGAQQMATFLGQKQSLATLIPAMNNLIAQQRGVNATQEDAYGIANLMGKAMQGQTSALRRVGITFTDTQEKVMKMGTEEERAAMLAQIITDNVGDMNAALGKTDIGKQKQLEMQIAAVKAQIGKLAQTALPYVAFAAQTTSLILSLKTLATGIGGVIGRVTAWSASLVSSTVVQKMWNATSIRMNALVQVCSASFRGAAVSATTLKLAIQGLLVSTGVGIAIVALTEIMSAFMSKSEEAKTSAEDAAESMKGMGDATDEVKDAYNNALQSTFSDLMGKYDKLKAAWKSLSSEQKKVEWIKENQSAFNELRLKINDVSEAENIFNRKTDAVVEAFKQRAMAAAYAAKLTALYQKQIALLDKKQKVTKSIADDAKQGGRNAKEGDIVPESWRSERYGKVGSDGQWRFTKVGAERYNGTNVSGNTQINGVDKELNNVDREIAATQKQLTERLKSANSFITADKPTAPTPAKTTPKTTPGKNDTTEPKTHLEELQAQLSAAQKEKGNAMTVEARVKADAKIQDIQAQIDEATKGKVSIEAETEPSYIVQGSDADKRQSHGNAQQRIDRIRQDYEMGIITNKDDAEKQIADINKQLTDLGLKPIEVHFKSHAEELQEQLHDAQREFEEATTIEAKVKADAKITDIQAQIDQATRGKVSIKADTEPSYIVQGSTADKRQSYANAQSKASRIGQDFEIGIIGKEEAQRQIDDLNKQIADLGGNLKPLKLEVDTKGFDKAFGSIKSGWGSVQGVGNGIQGISDALEGNGDAWQQITGLINGFISIAEGIQGIVALIQMLTAATTAHSAASTADAAATAGDAAASTANTAAKSGEAIANATASGAKLAFPMNLIAIAAGVAAVIAALAMVSGFATGGVVGGTSTSGDKKFARVNSGEMILNKFQQTRLFGMINGKYQPPTFAQGQTQPITMNNISNDVEPPTTIVNVNVSGDWKKALKVLSDTKRVASKSGRKYDI